MNGLKAIKNLLCGAAVGVANIIPGVSGGTMAVVLGVYPQLLEAMDKLMDRLDRRQQTILRLHFGMDDGTCHSLEEISGILGISKERTRQVEHQAFAKLKTMGAEMGLEDFLED